MSEEPPCPLCGQTITERTLRAENARLKREAGEHSVTLGHARQLSQELAAVRRERDAARAAALEQAAKLCEQRAFWLCDQDGRAPRSDDDPIGRSVYIGAHGCAAAIRALITPE